MGSFLRSAMGCLPPIGLLLLGGGCTDGDGAGTAGPGPGAVAGATTAPDGSAPESPGPGPGGAKSSPEIKKIMVRLTKGPDSLTPVIGAELKAESPPWDTIRGQTKEYAQLAAEMGKYDPPRGSKESWDRLAVAYAGMATDLDRAARAGDKDEALAAHGQITNSCNSCHREHRTMGPGMGGPPGGFRSGPGGPGGPGDGRPGGGGPGGPGRGGPGGPGGGGPPG